MTRLTGPADERNAVKGQKYADENGHLDDAAVIAAMVSAFPKLQAVLDADSDISEGLGCLQVALIAKALVDNVPGQPQAVKRVLDVAEEVLDAWGQEGRDFIGACMAEGVPDSGESVLAPFAGRLFIEQLAPYV